MLLLDKPRGLSSNHALQRARRLLDADKAGHGGTLDPLADGLLPLMFGEACKLADSSLQGDKTYEAVLRLGQTTTTDDAEGEVLATAQANFTDARLDEVLAEFRGEILQTPPIYSALKVAGKALYRHAREGNPIQPAPRHVTIHEITLLQRCLGDAPSLSLRVACGKGTYIRSLARDIGAALGCGAHLIALRRTVVGRFTVNEAIDLQALEALEPDARRGHLIGLEALVAGWPSVSLDEEASRRFRQGQSVVILRADLCSETVMPAPDNASASPARIAVHCEGRLIGLGRRTPTTESTCVLAPARIIVP